MSGPILLPTSPRPRRGVVGRLARLIPEPRVLRIFLAVAYSGVLATGIFGFMHPPRSVTATLSSLAYVHAAAAVVGAALAIVTVLIGRWWLERVSILTMATACAVYIVTTTAAWINDGGDRLPVLGWLWFAVVMLMARYITIRWSQIEPGR